MGKKKRMEEKAREMRTTEESKAAECAEKTGEVKCVKAAPVGRQEARAAAFLQKQEAKNSRIAAAAGVLLFFLTCLDAGNAVKIVSLLAILAGIAVLVWKRKAIRPRFGAVALLLTAYCVMITASGFYAPAGKFALLESIKYISALAVFFAVLGFAPERKPGVGAATAVELSAAGISLLSIDRAGAILISRVVLPFFFAVTREYGTLAALDRGHINSIFGNVNIFSGIAGLGVLLGLGLLSAERDAKRRRVHLVCLAINAIGFLDAFSRGATVVIAASFLVYLLLERGEARGRALVVMVETAAFAGIAAIIGYLTAFGSNGEMRFAALAATIVCAAGLAAFDELIGRRIADRLAAHTKAITLGIAVLLGAVVVFAVAALNLTGPATVGGDAVLYRATYPGAGVQTLRVEADGEVTLSVSYQSDADSYAGAEFLYEGKADGATFEVPESAAVIMLAFSSEEPCTISKAYYEGAESQSVKLRYLLIPEGLASSMQGIFEGTSFMQRRVLWRTGLQVWRESPIVGFGIGCFENKSLGIMQYHFETKYVHNHYIQALTDTGVIGLALFIGTLLACAASLVLARRREESDPLLPALGACLLFMAGQACTDVIFSSAFYLFSAFAVLAIIVVCSGDALRLPVGGKAKAWLPCTGLALLAAWVVLLGLNLYANSLMEFPTYNGLATAAKLDYYERNDYRLSYVCSACEYEERTEEITRQMYEYMEELEKVPSNTIPYYLGECYFKLDDVEKAFEMLRQYTAYSASNPEKWDEAYRLSFRYYDKSAAFTDGLTALYQSMLDWNAQSVQPIELADDVQKVITAVTGME